jgi:hypothetical protein
VGELRSTFRTQSDCIRFYCSAKASDIEVLAGNINRSVSRTHWIRSWVSQMYIHESYMELENYNDVALLKVGKNLS